MIVRVLQRIGTEGRTCISPHISSSSVLCRDLLTIIPSVIRLYLSRMLPIGLHASIIHLLSVYICHASVTYLSAICSPSIYSLIMHSSSICVHERGVYYKELAHTILEAGSQTPVDEGRPRRADGEAAGPSQKESWRSKFSPKAKLKTGKDQGHRQRV